MDQVYPMQEMARFPWEQSVEEVERMNKALEAGSGVDASSYSGGRALIYEDLSARLRDMTLTEQRYALWQFAPKPPTRSIVAMWNERSSFGERWATASSERAAPPVQTSGLGRKYATIAHYRASMTVTDILLRTDNSNDPEVVEEVAGTRRVLYAADQDGFIGNNAVFPSRCNGIYQQLLARYPANIVDYGGLVLSSKRFINQAAARINSLGGQLTDAFYSPLLHPDIEGLFDNNERFVSPLRPQDITGMPFPMGVTAGIPVANISTGHGLVRLHSDPCLPVAWDYPTVATPVLEAGATDYRPGACTDNLAAAAAGDGSGNIPAGDYYYRVTAVNEYGESITRVVGPVTCTANDKVTLTIDHDGTNTPTGYRIYRSAKDATDAGTCKFLAEAVFVDGADDTFVDDGSRVPGCADVYFLTQIPDQPCLQFHQLTPLIKKRFAETQWDRPFGLNLSGVWALELPKWAYIVKNVLTQADLDAGWDPLVVNA